MLPHITPFIEHDSTIEWRQISMEKLSISQEYYDSELFVNEKN